MPNEDVLDDLETLAGELIRGVLSKEPTVREGTVMTSGPPPYRRLDCDGRALAYVRARPRKRAVRVDVSGLWHAAQGSNIRVASASSAAALLLRDVRDLEEAVRFLLETVERTRNGKGGRRIRF